MPCIFYTAGCRRQQCRGAAATAVFAKVDNPSHTLFHTSPAHLRVVIFCVFRIVHCTFPCSRCVLRVAGCALQVASCELRVARCALRVARCELRAASCALCFSFILQKERKAVLQKKKQRRKRRRRQRRERSEKLIRGEKMRRLRTASTP